MRFGLLGPVAVWTDEGQPVAIPGAKVRALLAHLLIHAGAAVSTDRLIEDLWNGRPPAHPAGALQVKVSQLRRALDSAEPGGRALLASRPAGYVLGVDADAVDAGRFAQLTRRARAADDPATAAALLAEAAQLWRGEPLSDFADEPFAAAEIARLSELRLTALEDQVEARLALGEHGALAGELDALVAENPLRERLCAARMRALYGSGRQADALAAYQRLRTRLADEFGLDPGPELVRLQHAILTQDPRLDTQMVISRPRTNLPTPVSSLIGRDSAVVEVARMLDNGRLVTLTGPGGVGKTRLAIDVAARLADRMPDGAWLVEVDRPEEPCGAEGTTDWLSERIAAALGLQDAATLSTPAVGLAAGDLTDLSGRLAETLRDSTLLLVLDSCERAVESIATLADRLLRSAPGVHILATSREPLGLSGELLWPVQPLPLPDGEDADPGRIQEFSAVRLFVERATAARPDFAVTPDNAAAVAALCRRLDGLPLALELAAARTRVLPVPELAARLDDRFRLLAAGPRDAPERQRTLRAVMDWSWEPLSEPERAVFRRFAVHAGGATLESVEAVCAGDAVAAEDVVDLLGRLVDCSLVVADGARYRMLETIAGYAAERLDEAGETERTRMAHARHFADLAQRADARLRGPDQPRWLARLDADSSNLRAAVEWTVERGAAALALRLVGALCWYWFLRGRYAEAYRSVSSVVDVDGGAPAVDRAAALTWLSVIGEQTGRGSEAVAHARAARELYEQVDDAVARSRGRWLLGFVLQESGESESGGALIGEVTATFERLGDHWGQAAALSVSGWEALWHGDLATARRDGERSQRLFRDVGDRWGQVRTADLLGHVAEIHGEYERAERLHHDGLRLADELGLAPARVQQLGRLGRLAALAGDDDLATDYYERAIRLGEDHGCHPGVSFARLGLGMLTRRQLRLDVAEQLFTAVLEGDRGTGDQRRVAFEVAQLGFVAELRGDAAAARAWHAEGLAAARGAGDPRAIALALEGLAGADVVGGDHRHAAMLLGVAAAARRSVGAPLPAAERGDVDRIEAAARAALGDEGFTDAVRCGESLDLADCLVALSGSGRLAA